MGGILLYVIGIIFHWLYCKCLFFIGTFFFLSAQIHPPTLYLFWYYCVVAFPSVLGASVLKKPWHRWNANRPEMVAQNLWVRGREQVTEEPRGGGTPSPTGLQAPSQNFGLPYLWSHWNRVFFQKEGVKLTESNIWLMQEAKNMSKYLVQLWNHNDDKYNEIRMEKVIPSR